MAVKQIDAYPLTEQAYLSRFAPSRAIAEAMSKRRRSGALTTALRRMTKELPMDGWIVPQLNVCCVVMVDDTGRILKVIWDERLAHYPMVTSINEHAGCLYLCGINNNRVGRLELDASELGAIDPRAIPGASGQAPPFGGRTVDYFST